MVARTTKKKAMAKRNTNTGMATLREQMAKEMEAIDETVGSTAGDIIKIDQTRGEFFSIPGLGEAPAPMEAVIVDYISQNMYWPDKYNENNIKPPVCFAIGKNPSKLVPSKNSPEPQAKTCAECPMNAFGSAGAGKACKNNRVLALVPPNADATARISMMRVSPTGLKGVDTYLSSIPKKFNVLPVGVVTTFDTKAQGKGFTVTCSNPDNRMNERVEQDYARKAEALAMLESEPDLSGQETTKTAPKRASPKRRNTRR